MPINWQMPTGDVLPFADVREVIREGVRFAVPDATGARVYKNWIYEIDALTMLGKVTAAMRATSGTSLGKVHAWCIGISSAPWQLNEFGVPPILGSEGRMWTWQLAIDVWGFFENDGKEETQKAAEDEARLVSAVLWRNSSEIVAQVPQIGAVRPLQFSNLSPSPFSDGTSVIVAAGQMIVEVTEALS